MSPQKLKIKQICGFSPAICTELNKILHACRLRLHACKILFKALLSLAKSAVIGYGVGNDISKNFTLLGKLVSTIYSVTAAA